ncbi:MAG: DUF2474 domain-containing protein [Alphaproteobacteria bacterium]|nr:DUF2474 domain-containing protein [Alphaproteobacteria bacterium]
MPDTAPAGNRRQANAGNTPRPVLRRLAWFVAIWAASVSALAVVAFLIKLAL